MSVGSVIIGIIFFLLIASLIGIPIGYKKFKKYAKKLEDNIPEGLAEQVAEERKKLNVIAKQEEAQQATFNKKGYGVQGSPFKPREEEPEPKETPVEETRKEDAEANKDE